MRIISKTVYTFDELTESGKDRARDWWRSVSSDSWSEESRESIEAFCNKFGIRLRNWSISAYDGFSYRLSDFDNATFRGVRLSQFTREDYPTGYCLDADISVAFFDTFKATGDAKRAFKVAIEAGFSEWLQDLIFQQTDEYVDEHIMANAYEFDEMGRAV